MRKKLLVWLIWFSLILAGCGSKENPEEVIKQTQANLIDHMQDIVFAKKKGEFESKLKVNFSSPIANGKLWLIATGLMNNYTWLINVLWSGDFFYQGLSGSANVWLSFITTLDKIYFKLNHISANLPDPKLNAYLAMIKMAENKWFFTKNTYQTANLKTPDFRKELKKYPLFKAEKVIEKYKYQVELDKDNLAKIILDVNKQLNSWANLSLEDVKKQLTWFNVEWLLSIEQDKLHFSFSWYLENITQKVPVKLVYLNNKFRLDLPTLDLNLDKSDDNFNGYLLLKTVGVKLDVSGKLNSEEFDVNLKYNQQPIDALVDFYYKVKEKNNIKIVLPKNAIPFEEVLWGFGLNSSGLGTGDLQNIWK